MYKTKWPRCVIGLLWLGLLSSCITNTTRTNLLPITTRTNLFMESESNGFVTVEQVVNDKITDLVCLELNYSLECYLDVGTVMNYGGSLGSVGGVGYKGYMDKNDVVQYRIPICENKPIKRIQMRSESVVRTSVHNKIVTLHGKEMEELIIEPSSSGWLINGSHDICRFRQLIRSRQGVR